MNEKCLVKLQKDMLLKNFTSGTREDYYRFPESVNHLGEIFSENLKILCLWRYVFLQCFHPIVKKYLESYNPKTLAVIRFLAHFHLLGSRIQGFVKKFLEFVNKEAMSVTYADIRKFIFHLKDDENKKASTINVYTAAIRFFFEYTLGYVWDSKKIPKMKRDRQLPVILSREQVNQLIESINNYKHKAITATMYSSGLRVSEVCHLRYEDIHRKQKMIHVPLSKNRQDRYTILSDKNLEILTEYWYRYDRPKGWLFPSTVRDEPLTSATVEQFIKKYAQNLGLPKGVTPHTMRHCFACHALEDGISHTYIVSDE